MSDKDDFSLSEVHEMIQGGTRVLIRRVRPEDTALYPDFLSDISAEDLRLRFFARITKGADAEPRWLHQQIPRQTLGDGCGAISRFGSHRDRPLT
jgi:hypothetical protein